MVIPFIVIFFIVRLSTHRSSHLLNCELPRKGTFSCLFGHSILKSFALLYTEIEDAGEKEHGLVLRQTRT